MKKRVLVALAIVGATGCSMFETMPAPIPYNDAAPDYAECIQLADKGKKIANRDSVLGWTTALAAAGVAAAGVAVSNDADGSWWDTGRKYYFIGAAVPVAALSAYFFSLSSDDAKAAGGAAAAMGIVDKRLAYNTCAQARSDWLESRVTTNAQAEANLIKAGQDGGVLGQH